VISTRFLFTIFEKLAESDFFQSELYEESEKHCKALQLCAGSELGSNNQKEISFYLPNVQLSHQNDAGNYFRLND